MRFLDERAQLLARRFLQASLALMDQMVMQFRLAKIPQSQDYSRETGGIRLWHPQQDGDPVW